MAFDQRVFVSFNPFYVYVAQADVKPGCVLRSSNVASVLRDEKLVTENEIRACRRNRNTWAYVGELNKKPQLTCVYQSADAQNEFVYRTPDVAGVFDDNQGGSAPGVEPVSTGKAIKQGLTEGQMELMRQQAIEFENGEM
eukprot:CAMPEP_0116863752 /NCGR_PEP_ID=MMETSP0418-20121206/24414_1 /TAXON_ID=1158023 /ORGANISM="Astrosyne radiata, Strain 13vi08-1A" /LENGTH=139 /DNA_ID=CAMNT_0004498843 /DNA_START=227 /DNA_END=646 /DNA_ORIENTATION=+